MGTPFRGFQPRKISRFDSGVKRADHVGRALRRSPDSRGGLPRSSIVSDLPELSAIPVVWLKNWLPRNWKIREVRASKAYKFARRRHSAFIVAGALVVEEGRI